MRRTTDARKRHFLVGRDERQLFMCRLPRACTTVAEAHTALRVPEAKAEARSVLERAIRQGEWFFVPADVGDVTFHRGEIARRRLWVRRRASIGAFIARAGKPHIVDELVEVRDERGNRRSVRARAGAARRSPDGAALIAGIGCFVIVRSMKGARRSAAAGSTERSNGKGANMVTLKGKQVPIKMWARVEEVESAALTQLKNIAALPWCFSHVAVMPDVHLGKGATVGSVVAMKDAIAPAAVGVDIGCGMAAQRTSLTSHDLPDCLGELRAAIEAEIPVGFSRITTTAGCRTTQSLFDEFGALVDAVQSLEGRARKQLGSLGGGNHFIELCLDTEDRVWLMLHSGSRNIGKELAEIHIKRARRSSRTTSSCPIASWRCSSPARARWPSTVATCSGRSATRRSTGA